MRPVFRPIFADPDPLNPRASFPRLCLFFLVTTLVLLAGCRKKELTPNEIRAITREMVLGVKGVLGSEAEIGMRPESWLPQKMRSSGGRASRAPAADHIYITVMPERAGEPASARVAAAEKELDLVASRHGLRRENRPGAPGLARVDYWLGGRRTHAIHLVTPLFWQRSARGFRRVRVPAAQLAIIIDDLGYDRSPADALMALSFPLSVSVLPHLPYSADIAEEAYRRGYQVLLHLPMQSDGGERQEAVELRPGMSSGEVTRVLAEMLDTVPHAVGVNNHQGSLATADAALMKALMPELRERNLLFIDSRTTAATVAYEVARRAGVKAAFRNIFLDDVAAPEAVRQQLDRAAHQAHQQGFAIAIGHPHPVTLQTLQEYVPQLEARGIRLVFASEIVRQR